MPKAPNAGTGVATEPPPPAAGQDKFHVTEDGAPPLGVTVQDKVPVVAGLPAVGCVQLKPSAVCAPLVVHVCEPPPVIENPLGAVQLKVVEPPPDAPDVVGVMLPVPPVKLTVVLGAGLYVAVGLVAPPPEAAGQVTGQLRVAVVPPASSVQLNVPPVTAEAPIVQETLAVPDAPALPIAVTPPPGVVETVNPVAPVTEQALTFVVAPAPVPLPSVLMVTATLPVLVAPVVPLVMVTAVPAVGL